MKMTTGILPPNSSILKKIIESSDITYGDELSILVRDHSKEIKGEVWDGLPEAAREELRNKGYYREGDNIYFE